MYNYIIFGGRFSMKKRIRRDMPIIINSAFFTIIILFFIYFVLCFPTFIVNKNGGVNDPLQWLWDTIITFIKNHDSLKIIVLELYYKVPMWTFKPVILIATISMVIGFIQNKKKWWYYLILVIMVPMCIIVWKCYGMMLEA